MKIRFIAIFILISVSLFAGESADEIMLKYDRLKKPEYSSNITTMILINNSGKKKIRKMEVYTAKTEKGENSFIEFLLPADVKGTKFLTIGNDNGNDEQRLFLPALNRIRKISSSGKKGKFMGSDLTFYDMETKKLKDFTYKLSGEGSIEGRPCWIIESTPTDTDAPYSKAYLYISREDYYCYKRELFDKSGEHVKTITIVETKIIDGIIIPTKIFVDNLEENHKTLMSVSDIKINCEIDRSKFTIKNLKG